MRTDSAAKADPAAERIRTPKSKTKQRLVRTRYDNRIRIMACLHPVLASDLKLADLYATSPLDTYLAPFQGLNTASSMTIL